MEVWLQRISHSFEAKLAYKERLCQLVKGKSVEVWNNDWITAPSLKAALAPSHIVNKLKLQALKPVIKPNEIALFAKSGY
jgi:hypothetical protein